MQKYHIESNLTKNKEAKEFEIPFRSDGEFV